MRIENLNSITLTIFGHLAHWYVQSFQQSDQLHVVLYEKKMDSDLKVGLRNSYRRVDGNFLVALLGKENFHQLLNQQTLN